VEIRNAVIVARAAAASHNLDGGCDDAAGNYQRRQTVFRNRCSLSTLPSAPAS